MSQAVVFAAFLPCLFCPAMIYGYLRVLKYKRRQIDTILSQPGVADAFRNTLAIKTLMSAHDDVNQAINRVFGFNYNWRTYVFPTVCNVALLALGIQISLAFVGLNPFPSRPLQDLILKLPATFFAGISGAFIWGAYDLLQRYGDVSLTPVALHLAWIRILVAAVLSGLVQFAVAAPITPLVAFAIGTFPLQSLQQFLKASAKDKIAVSSADASASPPNLNSLQGMSEKTYAQLEAECITTTQQLANAEAIKLLLNTNLEWASIIDLIDQAMLHMYLGDDMQKIRPLGIRGAIEFAAMYCCVHSPDADEAALSAKLVTDVAAKLGISETAVSSLAETLWKDPKQQYIRNLWFGTGTKTTQAPDVAVPQHA